MSHLRLCALALLALSSVPAAALEATRTRETYFTPDAAPELAGDYLRTHPGDAIQIVTLNVAGRDPADTYFAFGPVARSAQGVCRFDTKQIFPHKADDGKIAWDSTPPSPRDYVQPPVTMAAIAPAPCPRQNDTGYVFLEKGVSDVEFMAAVKFWKDVTVSAEKFDDSADYLSFILSPRLKQRFAAFRTAALSPSGAPRLAAIFRNGLNDLDLGFSATEGETANFFVSVSKSASGFQMINFQTQY